MLSRFSADPMVALVVVGMSLVLKCTPQPGPPVPPVQPDADAVAPSPAPAPPVPTPTPVPVADSAPPRDLYDDACSTLKRIGCREGRFTVCADRMRRAEAGHLFVTHAACIAKAKTMADVVACGAGCTVP